MTRKLNLHTLALWAALPMARTAQVESRLHMILKPNASRRALTRRALLMALVPATFAVGAIAALRPAAVAEAALFQHTFPNGAVLERVADSGAGKTAPPLVLTLHYALNHQPQAVWTAPAFKDDYLSQGSGVYLRKPRLTTWAAKRPGLNERHPPETVTAASQATVRYQFPVKPDTTISSFYVGVAAGPWTLSVDGPKKDGKVYLPEPSGHVIWTLVVHKHQDGAILMVSDHFSNPGPLTAKNELQVALFDAETYERVIYALNSKGQVLSELYAFPLTASDDGINYRKTMQTVHVSSALLRRTAKFRLVARPYEWTKLTVSSASAKR